MNVIISGTAKGSGSDRYRWVSYLSAEAKQALDDGSALVICERPFSDGRGDWYVVEKSHTKRSTWNHRLPTDEEAKTIKKAGM